MTITKKIHSTLVKLNKEIRLFGVKRIGLFGSYAVGKQHPNSDVDLLVEFLPGQKSFDHFMDLKFFLQKKLGKRIDLVIKDTLKPSIKAEILKEVIYA